MGLGRVEIISPTLGFESGTIQLVAVSYTYWTTPAVTPILFVKYLIIFRFYWTFNNIQWEVQILNVACDRLLTADCTMSVLLVLLNFKPFLYRQCEMRQFWAANLNMLISFTHNSEFNIPLVTPRWGRFC